VKNPESDSAGWGRSSATRRWVGQQDFRSPSDTCGISRRL